MPTPTFPEAMLSGGPSGPRIWALLGGKRGDNDQVCALAQALGWVWEERNLSYNGLYRCPNILLGASLVSLTPAARTQIAPPWPDLVVAAGRRAAPVARWIQKQSGGKTRLVHVGRPRAPLRWFDLVITTPQYGLPRLDNVIHLDLPLQNANRAQDSPPEAWAENAKALPRPWTGVLVGGSTWPFLLEGAAARALAGDLNRQIAADQGAALVTTSPRSSRGVADILKRELTCPHLLHSWQAGEANPYQAILASADRFLVTGDSVSMLAEACRTGKAVAIWQVPQRQDPWSRLKLSLGRQADSGSGLGALLSWTTAQGFLWPARSVGRVTSGLVASGQAAWFDSGSPWDFRPGEVSLDRDMAQAVERVRNLFAA